VRLFHNEALTAEEQIGGNVVESLNINDLPLPGLPDLLEISAWYGN
jgi:hypothetical protein